MRRSILPGAGALPAIFLLAALLVGAAAAAPALDLEKYVWDGTDWQDADTIATAPQLLGGDALMFKYVVTNTGDVSLAPVVVFDTVLGAIGSVPSLAVGASAEFTWTGTVPRGSYGPGVLYRDNTGMTQGWENYGGEGLVAEDSDIAYYGAINPWVLIEKYVWDGAAWQDANTAPGPTLVPGTDPEFRYVVTNVGSGTLTDITVTDDVLGPIATIASLDYGVSYDTTRTGTWSPGQQTNEATATTTYSGLEVTDTDVANYYGPVVAIDVEKEVSIDGGVTYVDADTAETGPLVPAGVDPRVRFTVTNTGDVDLKDVTLSDTVYDLSATIIGTLNIGNSYSTFFTVPRVPGEHMDTATATGTSTVGQGDATDTDSAYWSVGSPLSDGDYLTYSQGAYAGKGTAAKLLTKYWASAFPQGLDVGVIDGGNGYLWHSTSTGLANLKKFLTAGGTPGMITQDAYDPTKPLYGGGSLATQTATLGITLRLDHLGLLGTGGNFGDLVYFPTDPTKPYAGMTVSEISDAANTALAGLAPSDPYYPALTDLVKNLNTAFDGGKVSGWAKQNLVPPNPI